MKHKIIIGLFILTSCATYQKKPLTFIPGTTISFIQNEDSLPKNAQRIENVFIYNKDSVIVGSYNVVRFDKDSLIIGSDYKLITINDFPSASIQLRRLRNAKFNTYYLPSTNKSFIDFVVLHYYDKKLYNLTIFAKKQCNIDSLLLVVQYFYESRFSSTHYEWNKNPYNKRYGEDYKGRFGEWTCEFGSLRRTNIYVNYTRDYIFDEVAISITNLKVQPPYYHF